MDPCFTPVESPESNGMAEAFVKTFKRDYVRVNPIPDAATALPELPYRTARPDYGLVRDGVSSAEPGRSAPFKTQQL
jgi:hypothetical protein